MYSTESQSNKFQFRIGILIALGIMLLIIKKIMTMKNLIPAMLAMIFLSSCTTTHSLFQSENFVLPTDSTFQAFFRPVEPLIKSGDKITISIWGHENLSIGSVNGSFNSNEATGKWLVLNEEGEANLPKLGRVKLAGLTINEANYHLQNEYSRILKDPIINIKVLNHFVTILGEVNDPGKYMIDNENLTLIELIGLSDGLSPYAKNDEVQVIRQINGQTIKLQINLRELVGLVQKNITLQPDDIVYVAPEKTKGSDVNLQKASIVASILTGMAVIVSVLVK